MDRESIDRIKEKLTQKYGGKEGAERLFDRAAVLTTKLCEEHAKLREGISASEDFLCLTYSIYMMIDSIKSGRIPWSPGYPDGEGPTPKGAIMELLMALYMVGRNELLVPNPIEESLEG